MGLLDNLMTNSDFGGQTGGLLDFLRQTQMQNSQYQPSAGFASDQPPASFAGRFDAAQNMAPPLAIGGYQMPRMGNVAQFRPDPAALPQNAQAAQGQMPAQMPTDVSAQSRPQMQQQELPPALGGTGEGFLGKLSAGLQSIGNGGSLIGALTGNRTDPISQGQQNLSAQYQAVQQTLLASGLSPREAQSKAMLAVMNPEAGKTILTEALTNKEKYGVVSENPIEGKKYGFINERDQTVNGQAVGAANSGGGQTTSGLLAPGVNQYNPNLSGEEYLKQFSPEVQAATKAYIAGDVMPSGNPRQQGIAAQAKSIAQKYGADLGIPVSDALYGEKRKYRTELGSNSANSAGGQAKAFNQGISHLSDLADKLEKLDNSNGMGIPAVAGVVNSVRQGVSVNQSAISDEAKSIGQTVAGEVGKLFSGSAGGGVHERELTRERFDTVKSKPQLAAALRATIETMSGGLSALEQNRDRILGPNSGVDFVGDVTRQKIAKIQEVVDRLEGKSGAAQTNSGKPASVVQNGHTYTLQSDGSYK